ncbi:hypothetical protein BKA62DRAFT_761961 [Auriculariales sp. MPI-PUGE-AT-0066]|nr:hypothetical protein BKA62DRAFT_761961 [Auriculariales sp. MPI-PUGE-AT-0066]
MSTHDAVVSITGGHTAVKDADDAPRVSKDRNAERSSDEVNALREQPTGSQHNQRRQSNRRDGRDENEGNRRDEDESHGHASRNGGHRRRGAPPRTSRLQRELASERRAAREREQDLSSALAQAETQLATVRDGATAMRDFAEAESVDGQAVLNRFNDLIEAVNDLCFCVVNKLSDEQLSELLRPQGIRWLLERHPDVGKIVGAYLSLKGATNATVGDVILSAMQAIVFATLEDSVFAPFCPTASHTPDIDQTTLWLQNQVTQQDPSANLTLESQERAGRWRAITYNAVRSAGDDKVANRLVKIMHQQLSVVIQTLLPPTDAFKLFVQATLDELGGRTHKTVLQAIQHQHSIKSDYISCDYTVFFPVSRQLFTPSHNVLAEEVDTLKSLAETVKPSDKGKVLLPITVGLRATKTDAGKQTQTVLVKAKVIAVL